MWLFQSPSFCSTDDGSSFTLHNLLRLKLDWIIRHKFWVHLSLSSAKEQISLLSTRFSNPTPKKRSIIFPVPCWHAVLLADVALWGLWGWWISLDVPGTQDSACWPCFCSWIYYIWFNIALSLLTLLEFER